MTNAPGTTPGQPSGLSADEQLDRFARRLHRHLGGPHTLEQVREAIAKSGGLPSGLAAPGAAPEAAASRPGAAFPRFTLGWVPGERARRGDDFLHVLRDGAPVCTLVCRQAIRWRATLGPELERKARFVAGALERLESMLRAGAGGAELGEGEPASNWSACFLADEEEEGCGWFEIGMNDAPADLLGGFDEFCVVFGYSEKMQPWLVSDRGPLRAAAYLAAQQVLTALRLVGPYLAEAPADTPAQAARDASRRCFDYCPEQFRRFFTTPTVQQRERIGQAFTVLGHDHAVEAELDEFEDRYRIRFEDGAEISAWGYEVCRLRPPAA